MSKVLIFYLVKFILPLQLRVHARIQTTERWAKTIWNVQTARSGLATKIRNVMHERPSYTDNGLKDAGPQVIFALSCTKIYVKQLTMFLRISISMNISVYSCLWRRNYFFWDHHSIYQLPQPVPCNAKLWVDNHISQGRQNSPGVCSFWFRIWKYVPIRLVRSARWEHLKLSFNWRSIVWRWNS